MPVVWDDAQPRGYGSSATGNLVLTTRGRTACSPSSRIPTKRAPASGRACPASSGTRRSCGPRPARKSLATHNSEANNFGRIPLIVTKTYGAGKILFMGTDGAWRWRKGVEDRYHYRFWGQVVRWMAYQRNMSQGKNMRLFYSPDRPRTGAVLTLNANVSSATGEPLHDGAVIAGIVAPSGKTASVRLAPAGQDAWGLFTGLFTPSEPGDYQVHLSSADAGSTLDTTVSVQGASREKLGQPARVDVLREIAQITRGAVMSNTTPQAVAAAIAALPQPELLERRVRLWAHPLWAATLIFLLGIFWAGRKAAGSF